MNRAFASLLTCLGTVAAFGIPGAACLTRPVDTWRPALTTTFMSTIRSETVDKLDVLYMIDNSASMGDKQALLAQAVPDMISRLVSPNCVDATGNTIGPSTDGQCARGKLEFPPVHDMHLGIVSSSLGARGGDVCNPANTNPANPSLNAHQDDRGELVARGGVAEANVSHAGSLNFLAWFPTVAANQGGTTPPVPAETAIGAPGQAGTLIGDFASMIQGVNEHGCGYEAQNEAWYRFLVQPDPYDSITVDANNLASMTGIDSVLLQQRAAFLRPDSLLAIIVMTDENEQVSNPLAVGKQAWAFETYPFKSAPANAGAPEGTVACGSFSSTPGPNPGPNSPGCTSCGLSSLQRSPTFAQQCPADSPNGTTGYLDPTDDGILLRFFDEKQRFGVTARYPISRYVNALTSATVPSQDHETDGLGNYVGDQAQYQNCINPIFAQNLPTSATADLCHLTRGPRTADQVFYAAIAGVPHQLLQASPGDRECPAGTNATDCPQKERLVDADWTKIIGKDPVNYDFTGMDFHMLESAVPRTGSSCAPASNDDCDRVNGREWDSKKQDLQFACIFPLVDPQTGAAQPKDCTQPVYSGACDCGAGSYDNGAPLCQKDATGAYTQFQINGKAYPSAREMQIAHAAGAQGIVSSLCPIHAVASSATDPVFGYRPAVTAIVNRLKNALSVQCLPRNLNVDAKTQTVPCLVLATLAKGDCSTVPGMSDPPADVLSRFQEAQRSAYLASCGGKTSCVLQDPSTLPTCQLQELTRATHNGTDFQNGDCSASTNPGWCYVVGAAASSCAQQILFTSGEPPQGATVTLQCLLANGTGT